MELVKDPGRKMAGISVGARAMAKALGVKRRKLLAKEAPSSPLHSFRGTPSNPFNLLDETIKPHHRS
jgi:hypothetical protein